MRTWLFFLSILIVSSCLKNDENKVETLKVGKFRTELQDTDEVSIALRNDSLQIETYKGKTDTFAIKWIDPFEYVLIKKHPKNLLDSTEFHVKITRLKKDSYDFKAFYAGSNFTQKGTAYRIKD